jgi:hypothetical protein
MRLQDAWRFLVPVLLLATGSSFCVAQATIESLWSSADVPLNTDPESAFWSAARGVFIDADTRGKPVQGYRSEVRSRWSQQNLYFLFVCPYEQLNLKPEPKTASETNELWNWDVAEVFIGADFKDIRRYKEFEMSPQGEWIDLDIDLHHPHHESGWAWNSGFKVSARIDREKHVWYGAMKIPYVAIDSRSAAAGNLFRVNFFRSQGRGANRHQITWQPPMADTFHVPEHFGLLKLVNTN